MSHIEDETPPMAIWLHVPEKELPAPRNVGSGYVAEMLCLHPYVSLGDGGTFVLEMLAKHPFLRFSVYTHMQLEALRDLTTMLAEALERINRKTSPRDGMAITKSWRLFWFWCLGAYEIVRTMDQCRDRCFSSEFGQKIHALKKQLEVLRIPLAKQEYRGRPRRAIAAEASTIDIDFDVGDLTFEVEGEELSVRGTLDSFWSVIDAVSASDILADHREAYGCPPSSRAP